MSQSKTLFSVDWAENDGGQTLVRRFADRAKAERLFEQCKTSKARRGRGVMLSRETFEKHYDDWDCVASEQIDGVGGKEWQGPKDNFTPGEWFVDPGRDARSRGYIRSRALPNGWGGFGAVARVMTGTGSKTDADALLIAAAPKMLAALRAVKHFVLVEDDASRTALEQLNAAVMLATGKGGK
jgi:hypothetical protein